MEFTADSVLKTDSEHDRVVLDASSMLRPCHAAMPRSYRIELQELEELDLQSVFNEQVNLIAVLASARTVAKLLLPWAFVQWDEMAYRRWFREVDALHAELNGVRPQLIVVYSASVGRLVSELTGCVRRVEPCSDVERC